MLKKMISLIGTSLLLVLSLSSQSEAQILIQAQSYISGSGAPSGPIYFPDGTIALPSVTAASQTNKGFSFTISNYITLSGNGAAIWQAGGTGGGKGQFFASDAFLGWSTTSNPNATTDAFIRRSGTSTLTFDSNGAGANLTLFDLHTAAFNINGTAGASCTIVGATAHLTVVNGIVTLCN